MDLLFHNHYTIKSTTHTTLIFQQNYIFALLKNKFGLFLLNCLLYCVYLIGSVSNPNNVVESAAINILVFYNNHAEIVRLETVLKILKEKLLTK